jgi:hypothetical protein
MHHKCRLRYCERRKGEKMRKKKRANLSVEHRQLIKKLVTEMIKRQQ